MPELQQLAGNKSGVLVRDAEAVVADIHQAGGQPRAAGILDRPDRSLERRSPARLAPSFPHGRSTAGFVCFDFQVHVVAASLLRYCFSLRLSVRREMPSTAAAFC